MTENLYQPPSAESLPPEPIDRKCGRPLAITAVVLLAMPLVSLLVIMIQMSAAFAVLAESGQADPEALAGKLAGTMWITLMGWGCAVAAGVAGGVTLIGAGNRESWYAWSIGVLSALNLIIFPVGTLVGIALLIGLIVRWREFSTREVRR